MAVEAAFERGRRDPSTYGGDEGDRKAMKRWILVLFGAVLWSAVHAAEVKPKPVEIGYIESFDHSADVYVLKTGDTRREVAILAPVFDGDTIEVKHDFATLTLRLVGHAGPMVISKANDVATINGQVPQKSFLSGMFAWTTSVVQLFDREQREQVSASIRGNLESQTGNELSAPLLAKPQTLLAGRRKLTIGWVSPGVVEITILDGNGRPVVSGAGRERYGPPPKSTGSRASIRSSSRPLATPCARSCMSFRPIRVRTFRPRSAIRAHPSPCARLRRARGTPRRIRLICLKRCNT